MAVAPLVTRDTFAQLDANFEATLSQTSGPEKSLT